MNNCKICKALGNKPAIGCISEDTFLDPKPKEFNLLLPGQKSKKMYRNLWPIDRIKRKNVVF